MSILKAGRFWRSAGLAVLALSGGMLSASPAAAHHVMGGRLPATFMEGLLSGLGHPVIGPDHLAFIVAIGIAAALLRSGWAVVAIFLACSAAGVLGHVARLDVPFLEPLIAASVLAAGCALLWSRGTGERLWQLLAAIAGLLHGYAFGESIVGAEQPVLGAYLLGLAVIEALVAGLAMLATRRLIGADQANLQRVRWAGAALGCIGAVLLAGTLFLG